MRIFDMAHADRDFGHSAESTVTAVQALCTVCGEAKTKCICDMGEEKRVYFLENLSCAHCATQMEEQIRKIPGVTAAVISFVTKQLRLSASQYEIVLPKIREVCAKIEPDVQIVEPVQSSEFVEQVYRLEGLACANCGMKIEEKIAALDGVERVVLTYATKQLKVFAHPSTQLLEKMQEICTEIEDGVQIIPEKDAFKVSSVKKIFWRQNQTILELLTGAALFVIAQFVPGISEITAVALFVIAYIILGGKIVATAIRNLMRGRVFDENFLMSVATLGAFIIAEYPEAVGVMLFFRIGEFFEQRAVEKSRGQIMAAVDLRPEIVRLITKDGEHEIDPQSVRVGDVLFVRPGDRIPLDGILIEGKSRIDTSPITGEPVPVAAKVGTEVLSGCMNMSGAIKIQVTKRLEESMVTRILESVENAAARKPRIDRFITRFARVYTPFVVAVALFTAIVPSLISGNWNYWIYTALTFLVISCPCALVLSVPLAFFSGIGAGSKRGILFKGGVVLEALKSIKAVVVDKTGTITKGVFSVQDVIAVGRSERELLAVCAAAESASTHPVAQSIVEAAKKQALPFEPPTFVEEIAGQGIKAVVSGKEVLCGNRGLMERFGVSVKLSEVNAAGTEVLVAIERDYAGRLVISDEVKEEAKEAIEGLQALGIRTAMLTGDTHKSAEAVAAMVGIDEVRARLMPEEKFGALQELRKQYGSVMFVGDGINDAPVLAGADVGAAMGSGSDAAIEAADVVFMTSKVGAVGQALSIARRTSSIAWQNVAVALLVKAAVMVFGLAGFASMWMAVFADTGVAMLCVLNSVRILYRA